MYMPTTLTWVYIKGKLLILSFSTILSSVRAQKFELERVAESLCAAYEPDDEALNFSSSPVSNLRRVFCEKVAANIAHGH